MDIYYEPHEPLVSPNVLARQTTLRVVHQPYLYAEVEPVGDSCLRDSTVQYLGRDNVWPNETGGLVDRSGAGVDDSGSTRHATLFEGTFPMDTGTHAAVLSPISLPERSVPVSTSGDDSSAWVEGVQLHFANWKCARRGCARALP